MRASRLKRYLPLLVAAYVVAELVLLVTVAEQIGWLLTLLLLLAGFVAGASVVKRAGLRAFAAARRGTVPEGEARTAVTVAGGVLLMIPGFISDLLGLLCLVPPVARRLQRAPMALLRKGPLGDAVRLQEQVRIHRPDGKVVQGEVVHEDGTPHPAPYDYSRRDEPQGRGELRE
ncbi:FxsA family protein [Streptacidiphilus neutrinimicus]|uniref:FxsA family protein n=1 Tax=Streptacidiphilus neutrinimicus TaxID=105420 RepID=UPI000A8354C4|nr:FxsA family protein [Streptacidiphilus neutrinimicus]